LPPSLPAQDFRGRARGEPLIRIRKVGCALDYIGALGETMWYQSEYLGFLPRITSVKSFCNLAVTLPMPPVPIGRWSISRMGAILAAVPVKKHF